MPSHFTIAHSSLSECHDLIVLEYKLYRIGTNPQDKRKLTGHVLGSHSILASGWFSLARPLMLQSCWPSPKFISGVQPAVHSFYKLFLFPQHYLLRCLDPPGTRAPSLTELLTKVRQRSPSTVSISDPTPPSGGPMDEAESVNPKRTCMAMAGRRPRCKACAARGKTPWALWHTCPRWWQDWQCLIGNCESVDEVLLLLSQLLKPEVDQGTSNQGNHEVGCCFQMAKKRSRRQDFAM